jgi:hypothetical protein
MTRALFGESLVSVPEHPIELGRIEHSQSSVGHECEFTKDQSSWLRGNTGMKDEDDREHHEQNAIFVQ